MVSGAGQLTPLFNGAIVMLNVLVFLPMFALQSLQTPQFPEQSTGQIMVSGAGQIASLLNSCIMSNILVFVPVFALQSLQTPQFPEQSTGHAFVHVESVSVVLFAILQLIPPLLAGVFTVYILVLVPVLEIALLPSQVALHSLQVSQLPIQ
jgi:hypothetical protein